ncbi:MAG: hypothetical protein M3419_06890 [Actinomycetota bacterium]|nr:hypothetical protein [Actinomycetota bacterium]
MLPALRRRRRARGIGALAAALLLTAATLAAGAAGAAASTTEPQPTGPTVVIGVTSLRWADVSEAVTPTLWGLIAGSAVGSTSVRAVPSSTCPLDGWLSISAGTKATSRRLEPDRGTLNPGQASGDVDDIVCGPLPAVEDGQVPDWDRYAALQDSTTGAYGTPGALGDQLSDLGSCTLAVGPGAAVALAGTDGDVERYEPRWDPSLAGECPVVVIDAGSIDEQPGPRYDDLVAFDQLVADVLAVTDPGVQVLVSGVADPSASPAPFQVALRHTVGARKPSWLTSDSTRRSGLVQVIDLAATLLARGGAVPRSVDGKPWQGDEDRTLSVADTVEDRQDQDNLSTVIPERGPVLGAWIAAVPLCILLGGLCVLVARRRGASWPEHSLFAKLAIGAALFAASVPTALYLVTAVQWWRADRPALVLGAAAVVIALVIAAASRYARVHRPWRFVVVQCGLTYVALSIDGIAGTPLQAGSLLAAGPVYGGRFYGFGNVTFTVYATATLLLAAAVSQLLLDRGARGRAVGVVALIGAIAVVIDGWPALGADFGGIIALVPGVLLCALLVAGVTVTWARLLAVAAVGVLAVTVVAGQDYLRPPEQRSHMGAFVARVLDGSASDVLLSKLEALLASLTSPLGWLQVTGFVVAMLVVWRPVAMRVPELGGVYAAWPTLRPALLSLGLTCTIATFVNDSGALIAGFAVLTAAPLMIATCAWWTSRLVDVQPAAAPVRALR